ncbi:MAG: hypothetical protein WCS89_04560 [Candidatus Paceibacterota bacterium]
MPLTEESQVVYLLVEMRKILDHGLIRSYPLIRFYADWSVHTAKDRITPQIGFIMDNIYKEIIEKPLNKISDPAPKLLPFIDMMELRKEMGYFLGEHGLPDGLVNSNANWFSFRSNLANVLADQPILDPCNNIHRFAYKALKNNLVAIVVEYRKEDSTFGEFSVEEEAS